MSEQSLGEGDPYADLRQPGKVCEHEKLQRQCDLCFALRDVELLRARIAELEAKNKRLVEERDGAMAVLREIADTKNPEHYGNARDALHAVKLRAEAAIAANDARAGNGGRDEQA